MRGGAQGGMWGGAYEEKRLRRGILGGWAWRHMQGDARVRALLPPTRNQAPPGLGAAQGHSQQQQLVGRGICTTPLRLIFLDKNTWYGMVWYGLVRPLGIVGVRTIAQHRALM